MTKLQKALTFLAAIFLFIFLANIIYLDYIIFFHKSLSSAPVIIEQITGQKDQSKMEEKAVDSCYPYSCIDLIRNATASLKPQVIEKPVLPARQTAVVREFFIHLGSGTNNTDDWADIPGAEAYIDSTKYGNIKSVLFEAGVNIPTGNQTAYVRLYNVTDKHPVWFSEVSLEGGTPKLLVSSPISLDFGQKLYRVQMKTSLKFLAHLTSARVKITTE